MVISKQLYQLQAIDLEIESAEKALEQKTSQLGESQALIDARNRLTVAKQQLDELRHRQHSLEWDIDDLTVKIKAGDEKLYSGRIHNPKELSSLHQEVMSFKATRDRLETQALEMMVRLEQTEANVAAIGRESEQLEKEWRSQQQQLAKEIEQLQKKLADFKQKRQALSGGFDSASIELYGKLKKQKGQAVVKVEQGVCRGCRISLTSSEIQQVRGGNLVQCGSCGRILFLP